MELKPIRLTWTEDQTGEIDFNDGSKLKFSDHAEGSYTKIMDANGNPIEAGETGWQERDEISQNILRYEGELEVIKNDGAIEMTELQIHPSEVDGTATFNDGTRGYWSEGRGSDILLKFSDGRIETVQTVDEVTEPHAELMLGDETGDVPSRTMTREEAIDYHVTQGGMSEEEAEEHLNEIMEDDEGAAEEAAADLQWEAKSGS